jgi:hypothetical protein
VWHGCAYGVSECRRIGGLNMRHEYRIRLILFCVANWNLLRSELIHFAGSLKSLFVREFLMPKVAVRRVMNSVRP